MHRTPSRLLAALLILATAIALPSNIRALENAQHDQESASGTDYLSNQIWWNFGVVSTGLGDFLVSHPTSVTPLLWVGATPVVVDSAAGAGPFACPGTGYVLDGECGNGLANLATFCGVNLTTGLPGACHVAGNCVVMGSPTEDSSPAAGIAPDFRISYTAYPTQLFGATGEMFSNGDDVATNPYFTTQFLHVTHPSPVATLHFNTWVSASTGLACAAPDADAGAAVTVALGVGDHDYTTYDPYEGDSTCDPSDLTVEGVPSTHGADYDGSTTIRLRIGGHRLLTDAQVDAPTASAVLHETTGDVHTWTITAEGPGSHAVEFDATIACPSPFTGGDETLADDYVQWSRYKCMVAGSPGPDLRFNVGFVTMPSLSVGGTYAGGVVAHLDSDLRFATVEAPGSTPESFLAGVDADGNVEFCEPVSLLQKHFTPNDPQYPDQYALPLIRAPQAWDTTLGTTAMTVCVVDTGVDGSHADLAGARWLGGYDFIEDDADPDDEDGHGTHVAGIAAATTNNGVGVAGVAQANIRAAKVFGNSPESGADYIVASAIAWCASNGDGVINLSLGGDLPSGVLERAVDFAWQEGSILVAAAGNDYGSPVSFPAAYDRVIAVPCTDQADAKCDFSNVGPQNDLAAPGYQILSTCPDALPTCATPNAPICGYDAISQYSYCSGTSMSAPFVSGAAALVWSEYPTLSQEDLTIFLTCSAEDLGAPGGDPVFGRGRLDIEAALDAADTSTCPPPAAPLITYANGGVDSAYLEWILPDDGGSPVTSFEIYRGTCSGCETLVATTGPDPLRFRDNGLASGTTYYYRISAQTLYGGEGPLSNEVVVRTAPLPNPVDAGTLSCYPAQGTANSGSVALGSANSGRYTLVAVGSYSSGTGPDCVFEVGMNAASGNGWAVQPANPTPCTASGGTSCTAAISFDWWRSSHDVCFDVPYSLLVNGILVARGTFRFCDPPLVDHLPQAPPPPGSGPPAGPGLPPA